MSRITVISGGTATNSLVPLFGSLSPNISYVLPISDNGGSTSELIRVVGGPAIGDVRSRITRLIPDRAEAVRALLSLRLSSNGSKAKQQWEEIVEGTHELWDAVESQNKELIRPFFIHIHTELLKRSRVGREFRFEHASIGNLFLTGARLFLGSLDSAIELFLRITLVPDTYCVLPALNTNFSHHIAAELYNGKVITGQSQISHPSSDQPSNRAGFDSSGANHDTRLAHANSITPVQPSTAPTRTSTPFLRAIDSEDANLPFSHPDLLTSQLLFARKTEVPLESPIRRIYYINPYGHEIYPYASSRVISCLENTQILVYSIGSLYTSIIPVILLQGFAHAIENCSKKIMLLNGSRDRETRSVDVLAYVTAIIEACVYSLGNHHQVNFSGLISPVPFNWTPFVNYIFYLEGSDLAPTAKDQDVLKLKGVKCIGVDGTDTYDLVKLEQAFKRVIED